MVERLHGTPTQKDGETPKPPNVIEITDSDGVRLVRLNRPESKNAMNEALLDATTEAFIDAASNASVAVVVLTGSGDSFSAGQDLAEMALGATGGLRRDKHGFRGLAAQLASFPKPFLCAVNGKEWASERPLSVLPTLSSCRQRLDSSAHLRASASVRSWAAASRFLSW